jgi:hypothetical protein
MAGFNFTAAEFARLVEAFPSMNVDKTVCYKDFCDEVNGIFTKSNLEKLPLEEVTPILIPARRTLTSTS